MPSPNSTGKSPPANALYGWIKSYEIYLSKDGKNWGEPVAKGELSRDASLKTIKFTQVRQARFVRLKAISGFDKAAYASLAEMNIISKLPAAESAQDSEIAAWTLLVNSLFNLDIIKTRE